MPKNEGGASIKVALNVHAVRPGDTLVIQVSGMTLGSQNRANVDIAQVLPEVDDWVYGRDVPLEITPEGISLTLPDLHLNDTGLYKISSVRFMEGMTVGELRVPASALQECLFECGPDVADAGAAALVEKYKQIREARRAELLRGIGDETASTRKFTVIAFVKDCGLGTRMSLGQYEIMPSNDGLGLDAEISFLKRFVEKQGDRFEASPGSADDRKRQHPVMVAHFPVVHAESPEAALEIVVGELEGLNTLMSLHRGSHGDICAAIVTDPSTEHPRIVLWPELYRGNILAGFISGEDPVVIKRHLERMQADGRVRLYLSLFREAVAERHCELAYFRYWNLLEIIARDKGYPGQPSVDWNGQHVLNKKGKPIPVSNQAEDFVRHHLHLLYHTTAHSPEYKVGNRKTFNLDSLVAIWYRHRNCMSHSGGCTPSDCAQCVRGDPKYDNCRAAHDDVVAAHGTRNVDIDDFLSALHMTVRLVLRDELR